MVIWQDRRDYRVDSGEINHKGGANLKPEVAFKSRIGFKDTFDPHLRHLGMNLFAANREKYASAASDDITLELFFSCHDVQLSNRGMFDFNSCHLRLVPAFIPFDGN